MFSLAVGKCTLNESLLGGMNDLKPFIRAYTSFLHEAKSPNQFKTTHGQISSIFFLKFSQQCSKDFIYTFTKGKFASWFSHVYPSNLEQYLCPLLLERMMMV